MVVRQRSLTRLPVGAAVAVLSVWMAVNFLGAWREIALARQVCDLGGEVRFRLAWSMPHFRMVAVQFTSDQTPSQLNDAAKVLERAAGIRTLSLLGVDCDGKALEEFCGLAGLKRLYLRGCNGVDDQALAVVSQFRNLVVLDLGGTCVTDAGLHHLEQLTQLEHLVVPGRLRPNANEPHWIFELRCHLVEHWGPTLTVSRRGVEMLARMLPGCEIRQVA